MSSHAAPRLGVLIALSAVSVLPINLFLPALPAMARDLNAAFAVLNLAVAGYAVASAVVHLAAGALADRFGRRPVALGALAVFTLASVGCALSRDVGVFLFWRMLQASVIACYVVSLAAIRDTADEHTTASRIGQVSSAWAVVPMVAPTVGGVLDALWGWRACFWMLALCGAAGLWMALAKLRETRAAAPRTLAAQVAGYGALLRSVPFWAYSACMAFAVGTLYIFLGGAPLVAQQRGPVSGVVLGVGMGIVPTGFMLGTQMVARFSQRFAPLRLMVAGRIVTLLGLGLGLALWATGVTHLAAFFGPCLCIGLGNGLTMPVANSRVLSIRPDLAGSAIGLAAALTVAGAGAVAFVAGWFVQLHNAHGAVMGWMWASALVSLGAAWVAGKGSR